jgi:broad specificity phosphatase PhoE
MKAIFVRHGQSTGNAGFPTNDLSQLSLTELGQKQASLIADNWTEPPGLIVTSPYLRAIQTAAPTIARFPKARIETWPIQEFTYLEPSRWNGTSRAERLPQISAYWDDADPDYQDGPGAESFAALLRRAESAVDQLRAKSATENVVLFSHGQFIQAVWHAANHPNWTDREKKAHFWQFDQEHPIGNGELRDFTF